MAETPDNDAQMHQELSTAHHDPLIRSLHIIILLCVKVLAVLMALVIFLGVIDVGYVIYSRLMAPPFLMLDVGDLFQVFGAFMVVLIAIEIFINIRLYLGSNTLPIKLVVATALMAIARKIIVLDIENVTSTYVLAMSAVIIALGVTYWLIAHSGKTRTD